MQTEHSIQWCLEMSGYHDMKRTYAIKDQIKHQKPRSDCPAVQTTKNRNYSPQRRSWKTFQWEKATASWRNTRKKTNTLRRSDRIENVQSGNPVERRRGDRRSGRRIWEAGGGKGWRDWVKVREPCRPSSFPDEEVVWRRSEEGRGTLGEAEGWTILFFRSMPRIERGCLVKGVVRKKK